MEEYVIDTCTAELRKQRRIGEEEPAPPSPVGVLDAAACASCDNPGSTSHEPPSKRIRSSAPDVQHQQIRPTSCHFLIGGGRQRDRERQRERERDLILLLLLFFLFYFLKICGLYFSLSFCWVAILFVVDHLN